MTTLFKVGEYAVHLSIGESPSPKQVHAVRYALGLTQEQAAQVVYMDARTWRKWELGERAMLAAVFELFLIKTGVVTQ